MKQTYWSIWGSGFLGLDFEEDCLSDGRGSRIARDFFCGENFMHGFNCIIEPDVIVGDDVKLGHNVMLKSGTRILDDVEIADNCCTTGVCLIGNHVRIRTGSCISKSVIVNDWVFIGAGIMSSHTKNVWHGRPHMEQRQLVTRIGFGAIVGSRVNLMAGVIIAPGAIVGYAANVVSDLDREFGLYLGNPAEFISVAKDEWKIELTNLVFYGDGLSIDYVPHTFDPELLDRYLPHYRGNE